MSLLNDLGWPLSAKSRRRPPEKPSLLLRARRVTQLVSVSLLGSVIIGYATDHHPALRGMTHSGLSGAFRSPEIDALVLNARSLASNWGVTVVKLQARAERLAAIPSLRPVSGYISSGFSGSRWHPILNRARPHGGIDIAAPLGTRVLAAGTGRVKRVGNFGEFGLLIEISHGNGYVTRYAHLSRAAVVRGQRVERASKIGEVGESGLAIGPHLHYEVLLNGQKSNPASLSKNRASEDSFLRITPAAP
jgi:murein DD-endopeptidase MepM/ murein hydrolase activator NlpD